MKSLKKGVLALLISVLLFGCISAIEKLPIKTDNLPIKFPNLGLTACSNEFKDEKNGYSLCLPQGWKSQIVSNQYLLAEGDNGDSSVVIWPIVLGGTYKNIDALQLTNYIVGQIKQQYPDFTVVNISTTNDRRVVQVVATYTDENSKRLKGVMTTFLDANGNGFLTGYETLEANFDSKEEELRGIIGSYKIIKPTVTSTEASALVNYQTAGGELTVQVPQGWQVVTAGSCATLAVLAKDPQNPARQMFAFTGLGPVYYDPAIKQQSDSYYETCRQLGVTCYGQGSLDQLPLVTNVNSETYLTQAMPALGNTDFVRQAMPDYPIMSSMQIIDRQPLPQELAGFYTSSGLQYDGGLYTATFVQNGISAKGKFLLVVVYFQTVGFASAGPIYGISAPVDEFDSLESTLVASAKSIKLSDAYIRNCQEQQRAQGEALGQISKTLSETSDIVTRGWEERQETYDRISEKWSDTILGRERVYNPDTGEVYHVSNGFYDYYNIHREQYEYNSMRELTPEEYKLTPLDGQLNIK